MVVKTANDLPSYHAILVPVFDPAQDHAVTAIEIVLQLTDIESKAECPLLTLPLRIGITPTQRYDGDALKASDDYGHLSLTYTDTDGPDPTRTWASKRDPVGTISVHIKAVPRQVDATTPSGPRIELRGDQGGVFGKGSGFLPYPPADEDWRIQLDWELTDSAPPGTSAASLLGDGPSNVGFGRPQELIGNAVFAVGPLKRFPREKAAIAGTQNFAVYWIGTPPYDMDYVAPLAETIFLSIAHFFGDTTNSFRIFVRRVVSGRGGTGAFRSFMLEYSPGTEEEESEDALIDLLAHETVHEYPLETTGTIDDAWYSEGVANYYATIAPFEGGVVDRQYLIRALNNQAQAYYTSNTINLEWKYVTDHYWGGFDLTKDGYGCGFIYLTQVQGLIQRATNGEKGLDDMVMTLYKRQIRHEETHRDDFHDLVRKAIGDKEGDRSNSGSHGRRESHCAS